MTGKAMNSVDVWLVNSVLDERSFSMGYHGILKRLTLFIVMRLLGIKDLRGQLSQSPFPAKRPGGAAILTAHLDIAKRGTTDSVTLKCIR